MKFTTWIFFKDEKFNFDSPYSRLNFLSFAKKFAGQPIKLTLEEKVKPKSQQALGYYWGGIIPAIIAHDKGLLHRGALKNNPFILEDLIKSKKIKRDEIEEKHRDIMFTFRPDLVIDLKTGIKHRAGQELKKNNNTYLIELITEIIEAFEPQGYEFSDVERYKLARDKNIIINQLN